MSNTKDIFEIEVYREHTIKYNAKSDKFTVEFLVEDDWLEKGRKSLNECRKVIDEYIKNNFEFKPFFIIQKIWSEGKMTKLVGVRKDGGFILFDGKKTSTEISYIQEQLNGKKDRFFEYSSEYIDWLEKKSEVEKRHLAEIAEIKRQEPKLIPLDLTFVKEISNV